MRAAVSVCAAAKNKTGAHCAQRQPCCLAPSSFSPTPPLTVMALKYRSKSGTTTRWAYDLKPSIVISLMYMVAGRGVGAVAVCGGMCCNVRAQRRRKAESPRAEPSACLPVPGCRRPPWACACGHEGRPRGKWVCVRASGAARVLLLGVSAARRRRRSEDAK